MKPWPILIVALMASACAMHRDTPPADPQTLAAAKTARPTPLPAAPGVCTTAAAPVCCQAGSGAKAATGACVASAEACAQSGGTVSDTGVPGCA